MLSISVIVIAISLLAKIEANLVMDLSDYGVDDFKSELNNFDALFIKFYAPYCGRCIAIQNEFKNAAKTLSQDTPPIQLAEVDCTSDPGSKICSDFNAGSYPSLKLFKYGEFFKDFEGNKDAETMVDWVRKNTNFVSNRFRSFSDLNTAIAKTKEPVVIAIFKNNQHPLVEQWFKATTKVKRHWNYRDVEFMHIFEDFATGNSGLLKTIGLSSSKRLLPPAIVIHRPEWLHNDVESHNVVYEVESKEDLEQWIKRKAFGMIIWRTRDNAEEIKPPLIVAYYDVNFKSDPSFGHLWRNRMIRAALKNPELKFAISSSQTFRKVLRRQNLEPPRDREDPLVVGYDVFGVMYVMRDKFTVKNFDRYVEDFKKGDVAPHLKSEQPPTDNDERDVKIVVGATFPRMVTYNKKDVFIAFYAQWCKHSQELLPIWDELARQMKTEPNIEIQKMDAVANEVPDQLEVPQYPTLYFIPAKTKKPIKYPGGKMIHEFVQFVAFFSSEEMVGFHRDGSIRKPEAEKQGNETNESEAKMQIEEQKTEL